MRRSVEVYPKTRKKSCFMWLRPCYKIPDFSRYHPSSPPLWRFAAEIAAIRRLCIGLRVRYKYYRKNGLEPPKRRSQSKSAHKFIQYNNRGAFSFKAPARLPAGTAFSRTACRRPPAGRLLAEQAVQRADWWREVRSVAQAAWQAAWQAPARLPAQLNAPQVCAKFIQIGWDLVVWGPKTCFWVKTGNGHAWAGSVSVRYCFCFCPLFQNNVCLSDSLHNYATTISLFITLRLKNAPSLASLVLTCTDKFLFLTNFWQTASGHFQKWCAYSTFIVISL